MAGIQEIPEQPYIPAPVIKVVIEFSEDVNISTISSGIELFEVSNVTQLTPVNIFTRHITGKRFECELSAGEFNLTKSYRLYVNKGDNYNARDLLNTPLSESYKNFGKSTLVQPEDEIG